jgi:hypothetical protein
MTVNTTPTPGMEWSVGGRCCWRGAGCRGEGEGCAGQNSGRKGKEEGNGRERDGRVGLCGSWSMCYAGLTGQRPLLDQDEQNDQDGAGLDGGGPQVVDVLEVGREGWVMGGGRQ